MATPSEMLPGIQIGGAPKEVSLEDMLGQGKAAPQAISLDEMMGQAEPVQKQESWLDTFANIGKQVPALAARIVAGSKLQALEELQQADPTPERQQRIDQEKRVLQATAETFSETKQQKQSLLQRGVQGAAQSVAITGPAIVVGILTRNPALAAASMYPMSEGGTYGDLRLKDVPVQQARKHAAIDGFLEVGTELLPAHELFKTGTGPFKKLVRFMAAELPGESIATITQAINQRIAELPGNVTGQDFIDGFKLGMADLPETWVSTILAGGAQSGVVSLGEKAVTKAQEKSAGKAEAKKPGKKEDSLSGAFKDLAKTHKKGAEDLAKEIAESDPELAKLLTEALAEEQGKTAQPSQSVSLEEMLAQGQATVVGQEQKVVGTTESGKPRVQVKPRVRLGETAQQEQTTSVQPSAKPSADLSDIDFVTSQDAGKFLTRRISSNQSQTPLKAQDVLKDLQAYLGEDHEYSPLIKKLSTLNLDLDLLGHTRQDTKAVLEGKVGSNWGGLYTPFASTKSGRPLIELDLERYQRAGRQDEVVRTFLHEYVHAATYQAIMADPKKEKAIAQVMERVQNKAKEKGIPLLKRNGKEHYGFTDPHEFLSEVFTNKEFQMLLKSIKLDGMIAEKGVVETDAQGRPTKIVTKFHNYWEYVVSKLADMLGLTGKERTAFEAAITIGENIFENAEQQKASKAVLTDKYGWPEKAASAIEDLRKAVVDDETDPKSPVAFFQNGKPTTQAQVEQAFEDTPKTAKLPGQRGSVDPSVFAKPFLAAKDKLAGYLDEAIRTFAPEALGPEAKITGAVVAKAIAQRMAKESALTHRAQTRRDFWNARQKEVPDFIARFEKGEKFVDPVLNEAAEGYRAWAREMYIADRAKGIIYDEVESYLPHIFENESEVGKYFAAKYGVKWGDPGFMKDRTFDLYEEAIAAGFKPKFTNPEDIMLARQHASDLAHMKIDMLNELERNGLAVPTKQAKNKLPEGFTPAVWRSPTGVTYYVHEKANAILHNAFNTPSMWNMEGIKGDAFRGAMRLKNAIVPVQLALSLFHPLHVATIDNATAMKRATTELLTGKESIPRFMVRMAKAGLYTELLAETGGQLATLAGAKSRGGYRLLQIWQGKVPDSELTDSDAAAMQFMVEGGFVPEMSAQYRMGAMEKFHEAVSKGQKRAAFYAPFAAIDAIQAPMFKVWIPSLKIASYLRDVASALKNDPSLVDDQTRRQVVLRKLAKSVDNRYGEMAYSTLFWNRWVKDLGVASTLSLGWQLGFIREYGGSGGDLYKGLTTKGGLTEKTKQTLLDRPLFVLYYTAQSLAYGGLLTLALSGEPPEDLLDWTFPRSGETNPDGTPERIGTMFYAKEFVSIGKHMEHEGVLGGLAQTAANKAAPTIGLLKEWAYGVNYFGEELRDPNAPAYVKLGQQLKATLAYLEPLSVQAVRDGEPALLAGLGFSGAPRYVTDSSTVSSIRNLFQKYYGRQQTAYERAEYSRASRVLRKQFQNGDMRAFSEGLLKLQQDYELSAGDLRRFERSVASGQDPIFGMFQRLDWRQQKRLLDGMSEEEALAFLPYSNVEHLRYGYDLYATKRKKK